jgi:Mg/Co/Ni transporter MgtE
MNRFDKLEELLQDAEADEILHQVIENMSNAEGIAILNQVAVDLGIDDVDDLKDDDFDYDYDFDDEIYD